MSFFRNLLEPPIHRYGKETKLLQNCFYIFSLKDGCRMIAIFEALICGLQIYMVHQDEGKVITSTTGMPYLMVTHEPEGDIFGSNTRAPIFAANSYFYNALNTFALLNSLILLVGAELSNIPCLFIWLCVTIITKTIEELVHIIQGSDMLIMFFLTMSILIKIYFCLVVTSLILKLQNKHRASRSETEVLYTQCEEEA